MNQLLRVILLLSYLGGLVGLAAGVVLRFVPANFSSRGALSFAAACFLCSLATREAAAALTKPAEEAKAKAAAA